jgi:hypothetical protein
MLTSDYGSISGDYLSDISLLGRLLALPEILDLTGSKENSNLFVGK